METPEKINNILNSLYKHREKIEKDYISGVLKVIKNIDKLEHIEFIDFINGNPLHFEIKFKFKDCDFTTGLELELKQT